MIGITYLGVVKALVGLTLRDLEKIRFQLGILEISHLGLITQTGQGLLFHNNTLRL
jgi:hypothetical protein